MMRQRPVIQTVLDELKSGQPDAIEGLMIRPAGVGRRDRFGPQVRKRCQPATEDRPTRLVALRLNPPDPAGAVVQVEIGRQLIEVRTVHDATKCPASAQAADHWGAAAIS
jgi:hypothetical protein